MHWQYREYKWADTISLCKSGEKDPRSISSVNSSLYRFIVPTHTYISLCWKHWDMLLPDTEIGLTWISYEEPCPQCIPAQRTFSCAALAHYRSVKSMQQYLRKMQILDKRILLVIFSLLLMQMRIRNFTILWSNSIGQSALYYRLCFLSEKFFTLLNQQKSQFSELLNHVSAVDKTIIDTMLQRPIIVPLNYTSIDVIISSISKSNIPKASDLLWSTTYSPKDWEDAIILSLHKRKGDSTMCVYYGGFSLLSTARKVLANIDVNV